MAVSEDVKPNKAFQAIINRYPEESKPLLAKPAIIRFMNAWAPIYEQDKTLGLFYFAAIKGEYNRTHEESACSES